MTLHTFLLVMAIGAALLALWFVSRFPGLVPKRPRTMTASIVVAGLVPVAVAPAIHIVGVPFGPMAAIFGVALPACTYLFLVVAFVILFVKDALDGVLGR